MSMRAPTVRTLGSRSIVTTSTSESGGLRNHLQVSSVPSHASKEIGKRETKKVVGPLFSRSFATLALIPCTAAEISTTTKTPTAIPRIVRPARTLLARIESTAIVTPSFIVCSRCANIDMAYSARSAVMGSSREARLAG